MNAFNKITRGLQKIITKLEKLVESHAATVESHKDAIGNLHFQVDARHDAISSLNKEADRASATAAKLKYLVGV